MFLTFLLLSNIPCIYLLTFDVALMRFQEEAEVDLCAQQASFPE